MKTIYPRLVLQILCNIIILPYFNYCILTWRATISKGNPLYLSQKKALRLISNSNYIEHTKIICKNIAIAKAHQFLLKSSQEILLQISE